MNEKKAKAMRRVARKNTVGLPAVAYVLDSNPLRLARSTRMFYKLLKVKYANSSKV